MYETLKAHFFPIVLGSTFVLMTVLALIVADHKSQALIAGSLDYAYFLEFTSKAFDLSLADSLAVNPYNGGENMFFIAGPDGYPMWRWLHTELIKVVPSFLYTVTGVLLVPYAFYIVFFFLPLLYGAYLIWKRPEQGGTLTIALLAFATFPSTLLYATDLLRPFFLLFPFFICLVLSFSYKRSLREQVFFLILLLSVREEALVFAGAALLWHLFQLRRDGEPVKRVYILWSLWGIWAVFTAVYYLSSGYGFHPPLPLHVLLALTCVALIGGLLFLAWLWQRENRLWHYTPFVLFAAAAIGPMLIFFYGVDPHHWGRISLSFIYDRYTANVFYICIGVLIAYVLDQYATIWSKKIVSGLLLISIILGVASELVPHPSATYEYIERWDASRQDAELVHRAAATIPIHTPVLLDLTTIIAFYKHDHTYVYDYLPYALASTTGAAFPDNIEPLKKLIATDIPYAVVRNAEAQPLVDLLQKEGRSLETVEYNGTFSFYKIHN